MARKKKAPSTKQEPVKAKSAQPGDMGSTDNESTGRPVPIVGVGASAGGLEAISELLHALPRDTGMAFVLVQHLDPTHDSILAEILSRSTTMPVAQVKNGVAVEANHVYVIPPGSNMVLSGGELKLSPRTEIRGQHRSRTQESVFKEVEALVKSGVK